MWRMPVWKCRLQSKQINMPMQKSHTRTWRILRTMTKTRCCQDVMGYLLGSERRFGRSRLAMQMKRSQRRAKRPSRKSRRTDGSRAEADDPDATRGCEEDAEPSGSGNSRSKMFAAGLKRKSKP